MDDYYSAGGVSGLLGDKRKKKKTGTNNIKGRDTESVADQLFAADSISEEKLRQSLTARLEKLNRLAESAQQNRSTPKKRKLTAVYRREASLREADQGKPKKKKKKMKENSEAQDDQEDSLPQTVQNQAKEDVETPSQDAGSGSKRDRKAQRENRKRKKTKLEKNTRTVFVGNLPVSTTKKTLVNIFKEFGKVESVRFRSAAPADLKLPKRATVIMKEFHEKRHNINAYVVFEDKESMSKALSANGMLVDDLHIRVDKVHAGKDGKDSYNSKLSVFIGNLPFDVEEEAIREHFEDCGDIDGVRIIRDGKTGLGKGIGFVLFKDAGAVGLAMRLNKKQFLGRSLRVMKASVSLSKEKEKGKDKKINKPGAGPPSKMKMPTNVSSSSFQGLRAKKMTKIKKRLRHKKTMKKQKVTNKATKSDITTNKTKVTKKPVSKFSKGKR